VVKTGLCGACHLEALAAAHEAEIAKCDAQRLLWASRSKLRRRRRSIRQEAADVPETKTGDGGGKMVAEHTDPGEGTCTQ
jgi:hypothetical protein